ncbi:hypothetical protein PSTG_03152 [Puccinia striiformis f. sp. tritici PST-78]|uniref:Uncharacterized protein n=1 Tax=Puccinia striiformis f. sp. tritici PST-78 TaxID=1165861 RepID=A0A0L0VX95_9BASI|nr:hypothetical protein PSTG_03152 [Puccinia striiformis f. sp. tritici PST-78]
MPSNKTLQLSLKTTRVMKMRSLLIRKKKSTLATKQLKCFNIYKRGSMTRHLMITYLTAMKNIWNPSGQSLVKSSSQFQCSLLLANHNQEDSTKHVQKKQRLKALGANNNMMANYTITMKIPKGASNIDPNLDSATLGCIPESGHSNSLVKSRLATQYQHYCSAPRQINLKKKQEEKA